MTAANKTKSVSSETAVAPKILLYDVESFPNEGWTWGTWDQKVIKVRKRRMVCSIAWQWYPSHEKHVLALPDLPGYDPKKRTNVRLIKEFSKVLDQADIAVGHNIDQFDDPMVNTDILLNKLIPPMPHRSVDTLKFCRYKFRLNSNRLGDICEELGIGKKLKHPGFQMWEDCMAGKDAAWKVMKKYNAWDVDPLLRGLYEHIKPWMSNHPALKVRGDVACSLCQSKRLQSRGMRTNRTGKVPTYQCQDCGHWMTGILVNKKWVIR